MRLSGSSSRVVLEDLRERADRGERRAELVRDVRDEVVLHPVELLQLLVRDCAARRRRLASSRDFCSSSRLYFMICEASSRMLITSSMVSGASFTTEATMAWADAPPIAPASCVSANWTRLASASTSKAVLRWRCRA